MASTRPSVACPAGGLTIIDEDDTRSVAIEILKSLGRKILQGDFNDIMRISRPACISYPMTYLQACCEDFSFSQYLNMAAETNDPIRRLQFVTAFLIAGLHVVPVRVKNKPPLNPILGETYHAYKADGTEIWLEQTSHHPPVSHWEMIGPNGIYHFQGNGQVVAGLAGANTINGAKKGKNIITFRDGSRLEFTTPDMQIAGIMYGDRIINFIRNATIRDTTNKFVCEIQFGSYRSYVGWLASSLTR